MPRSLLVRYPWTAGSVVQSDLDSSCFCRASGLQKRGRSEFGKLVDVAQVLVVCVAANGISKEVGTYCREGDNPDPGQTGRLTT